MKVKKRNQGLPWQSSGWDLALQFDGEGLIPVQGAGISRASWSKNQKKHKQRRQLGNKFNKDFFLMAHIKKKNLKKKKRETSQALSFPIKGQQSGQVMEMTRINRSDPKPDLNSVTRGPEKVTYLISIFSLS